MDDSNATSPQPAAAPAWSTSGGQAWAAAQDLLDGLFFPLEGLLVGAVRSAGARRVLDIGCGAGGTTLAIAQHLGAGGTCTGVDISEPLIASARRRQAQAGVPADFVVADAQRHPFAAGAFDAVVSRFGVMFFDDPVAAFANLRRAAAPDAALRLIVWRSAGDNPFMTAAEEAAAPLLPNLPVRRPNEPGQFGFADAGHVRHILAASGWSDAQLRPLDVPCAMPESGLERYLANLGPVGRVLREAGDDELRRRVLAAVRPAFDRYVAGNQVHFDAACWMIEARG